MKNWLLLNSILLTLVLVKVLPTQGQNLIANGGFETITSCPTDYNQLFKAINWFNPISSSTPDLVSICSSNPNVSTPNNFFGYQIPLLGNSYGHIGIDNYTGSSHEYISYEFNPQLKEGTFYVVRFAISLANYSNHGMDRLGVLFEKNKPLYNTVNRIDKQPQIASKRNILLIDTASWTIIQDTFVAQGGEKYLTIGQFFPSDSLQFQTLLNPKFSWASYYIDDVSLYEVSIEPTIKIPNVFTPNGDGVNDELTIESKDALSLHTQIFNRWGSLVYDGVSLQPTWDGTFQGQPVADGVYFVVVQAAGSGATQIVEKQTVHLLR